MKALVSWEDDTGATHRWDLEYDEHDPEARHFLEALQLHVRFKLESFGAETAEAEAGGGPAGGGAGPAG
jgi:hypothetical protein